MIITKCKSGGFCFGVKRAVEKAENLASGSFLLGEIIHNEIVNKKLIDKGLKIISTDELDSLKEGDTLLIRTHGESQKILLKAKQKNLNIVDCTCPFVKEIQNIVEKHYNAGYTIAIIGSKDHPEVKGINGWCNDSAYIVDNADDLSRISAEKLCIVVQTTFKEEKFDEIIKNFDRSNVKIVDIFKTICYTTTERQKEAKILAQNNDAVIVIGGKNSNNTDKLFDICSSYCLNTFRIFNANDFDYEKIKKFNKIGVVLGASTPIEQFQEVISNMNTEETKISELVEEVKNEKPVKSEMEAAFDKIKPNKDFRIGQITTANISSATDNGLTLSIKNAKKDFELPKEEMLEDYKKENYLSKIGEEIRVMVIGKNPLKFSEKAMAKVLKEEAEIEEIKNGKIFEAKITATNKGGLTGKYGSYQVFVPSSQIKIGFAKDLEKYVGKTLRLKADKVESKGARRQIVGSQRVILLAEKEERDAIIAQKKAEFFGSIQEGDVVIGTPVRFAAFGAFIDVNGFDCLCHISDLSWTGCKDCAEVLELGKTYEFVILKIEQEKDRVSLGYKQLQPKPWESVAEKYNVGDVVKGKVVRLVNFGAFVEVEKGVDGLVHVSQISNEWLENPVKALEVGQEIEAKILDINVEKEKMTLSIKALLPEPEKPVVEKEEKVEEEPELREWTEDADAGVSIAEMIANTDK